MICCLNSSLTRTFRLFSTLETRDLEILKSSAIVFNVTLANLFLPPIKLSQPIYQLTLLYLVKMSLSIKKLHLYVSRFRWHVFFHKVHPLIFNKNMAFRYVFHLVYHSLILLLDLKQILLSEF